MAQPADNISTETDSEQAAATTTVDTTAPDTTAEPEAVGGDKEATKDAKAPEAPPKTFSQSEVEDMMRERIARERRRWKRQETAPKEPAQAAPKEMKGPEPADNEPTRAEWRAFERGVAGLGLTDRQIEVMEAEYLRNRPDRTDIGTFVADTAADLGWAKSDPKPTQREAQAPEAKVADPKPANPAAFDNNTAAQAPNWQQVVNPDQLTRDQIAQILNEKGMRAGRRYIRTLAERWHRNTVVVPPGQ